MAAIAGPPQIAVPMPIKLVILPETPKTFPTLKAVSNAEANVNSNTHSEPAPTSHTRVRLIFPPKLDDSELKNLFGRKSYTLRRPSRLT